MSEATSSAFGRIATIIGLWILFRIYFHLLFTHRLKSSKLPGAIVPLLVTVQFDLQF
ncbi:MAG: hypothetical protein HQK58_04505 [Deltaproteobacteria bacterium]|nr:hypothetical protein [Deltaproteobacteria bacterium]